MIELKNIKKTFQHRGKTITALDDISLSIAEGEIYGIVGQSGAGKSTLVRCINLLERPSSGEVIVDGKSLTTLSKNELLKTRRDIGMIFQHFNLLSSKTVYENIALPLVFAGASAQTIKEKVTPLLELTGLLEKAHHYPSQLSGGQKQRVAIARALSSSPKVLLSDEATSALDPKTTESILSLLKTINKTLGVTIVIITHEMEVVKSVCDRVALLEHGKLVETATVEAFFTEPQSELGKRFVEQSRQFDLPEHIQAELGEKAPNKKPIIRLEFLGQDVDSPVISTLSRDFSLDVNIIQAKVEHIRQTNIGLLVVELLGDDEKVSAALAHLKTLPIHVEVLGYVK